MIKPCQFITFEGPDGSGKTTLAKHFCEWLISQKVDTILTREPGGNGNKVAEAIRELVLDRKDLPIAPITEALLFAASRAQHVRDLIVPAIENHKLVVCDRFIDSSLAYQGYARNLGIDQVYQINQFATNGLLPDITFFIDLPADVGLARIRNGNRNKSDRLDEETATMHQLVYEGYLELIKKWPERFIIINGNQPFNDVFKEITKKFTPYLAGLK